MRAMDIKQRIETFNKGNAPWYIVEHDNGQYSLCLPLDLLSDDITRTARTHSTLTRRKSENRRTAKTDSAPTAADTNGRQHSERRSRTIRISEGFCSTARRAASSAMQMIWRCSKISEAGLRISARIRKALFLLSQKGSGRRKLAGRSRRLLCVLSDGS